jgi:hypothetical protein
MLRQAQHEVLTAVDAMKSLPHAEPFMLSLSKHEARTTVMQPIGQRELPFFHRR